MSSARAALAVAVVLSGTRTAPAEPCVPRAQLDGDAPAVAQVGAELRKLGVELGAAGRGCRTVRAQVELDREGGIAVAIVDGSRRSEGRVVSDAGVAAVWIDSWLRDDVDGISRGEPALLGPPALVRAAGRLGDEPAAPERPAAFASAAPERPAAASASPPALGRFALAAAYARTWTEDGAAAAGLDASACLRVGRACIGARVQYAREPDRPVNLTAMSRSDASIFATAGASFALGRMSLAPELALGVGRRRTQRLECTLTAGDPSMPPGTCDPADPSCPPPPCNDPMDPNCPPPPCNDPMDPNCQPPPAPPSCADDPGRIYVGDGLDAVTYTPRASATLRLSVPLFDHVWLEGLASVTIAPLGHRDPFARSPDPGMMPGMDATALPGEPWTALQLGVGLRIGAR